MSISTGLIAAYNKQASGASWLDLTTNGNNVALTNTTWENDGLRADASGEYGVFLNNGGQISLVGGTLIMRFKSLLSFSDSDSHALFGRYEGVIGNFAMMKLNDNNFYFYFHDGTARYIVFASSKMVNWENGIQIAAQWDISSNIYDGKKLALNIDGEYKTPNSSSNATSIVDYQSMNITLNVLNNSYNQGQFAGGDCDHWYLFNTVKTAAELAAIYANHNIILADYFYTQGTKTIGINVSVGL